MEMLLNDKNYDFAWPVMPHEAALRYDYAANNLFIPAGIAYKTMYDHPERARELIMAELLPRLLHDRLLDRS